ncbi:DUF4328 domain-containing protein [Planotetraspora kaengkrachanensis]|uniref:DUF4328 domain-containing protein n=1 Tax=Planotetraspora kaengkrachanensis TaxID=575193 RepID=A0A8J3LW87_9ACTN|nr:DUF4328 domain-containing protein [Planotetraspora kaengkrachanensis]GIG77653.1 hypothetical protein Pka01_07800 [Planotetraspora kaengkrachanensis]
MHPASPPDVLRPINGRAIVAAAALGLNALAAMASAVVGVQRLVLIGDLMAEPESVDVAEVEATDSVATAVAMVQYVAYVVAIVTFLIWLFRARRNAEPLAMWPHRRAMPWLIFGWVVPVVCWWFPKQIMDDIWASSKPGGLGLAHNFGEAQRSGLVWAWWLSWLGAVWGSKLVSNGLHPTDELESIRQAVLVGTVTDALLVVAAVLAAMVVLQISRFQEARRSVAVQQAVIAG